MLETSLNLQLAVSGSRSKVKSTATVRFDYQNIHEDRTFDIINIDSYDMILGTPFLYQHQILLGFNPAQVTVRSDHSLPIKCAQAITIELRVTSLQQGQIELY